MAEDVTNARGKPRLQSDAWMAQCVPFCIGRELDLRRGIQMGKQSLRR